MQSKRDSALEVFTNMFTGTIGSWCITWLSFKFIKNMELATTMTVFGCTVWSLVRGYSVRRYFNSRRNK